MCLGLAPGTAHHIVGITREFDNAEESGRFYLDKDCHMTLDEILEKTKTFHSSIRQLIPEENQLHFSYVGYIICEV